MKLRMNIGQIDFIFLNPFSGIDVEIPDELYEAYCLAVNQLNLIQQELQKVLMPQCEAVDEEINRWQTQEGLIIQNIPKPGETN